MARTEVATGVVPRQRLVTRLADVTRGPWTRRSPAQSRDPRGVSDRPGPTDRPQRSDVRREVPRRAERAFPDAPRRLQDLRSDSQQHPEAGDPAAGSEGPIRTGSCDPSPDQ